MGVTIKVEVFLREDRESGVYSQRNKKTSSVLLPRNKQALIKYLFIGNECQMALSS